MYTLEQIEWILLAVSLLQKNGSILLTTFSEIMCTQQSSWIQNQSMTTWEISTFFWASQGMTEKHPLKKLTSENPIHTQNTILWWCYVSVRPWCTSPPPGSRAHITQTNCDSVGMGKTLNGCFGAKPSKKGRWVVWLIDRRTEALGFLLLMFVVFVVNHKHSCRNAAISTRFFPRLLFSVMKGFNDEKF